MWRRTECHRHCIRVTRETAVPGVCADDNIGATSRRGEGGWQIGGTPGRYRRPVDTVVTNLLQLLWRCEAHANTPLLPRLQPVRPSSLALSTSAQQGCFRRTVGKRRGPWGRLDDPTHQGALTGSPTPYRLCMRCHAAHVPRHRSRDREVAQVHVVDRRCTPHHAIQRWPWPRRPGSKARTAGRRCFPCRW